MEKDKSAFEKIKKDIRAQIEKAKSEDLGLDADGSSKKIKPEQSDCLGDKRQSPLDEK